MTYFALQMLAVSPNLCLRLLAARQSLEKCGLAGIRTTQDKNPELESFILPEVRPLGNLVVLAVLATRSHTSWRCWKSEVKLLKGRYRLRIDWPFAAWEWGGLNVPPFA